MTKLLYTVPEAAELLGLGRTTLYEKMDGGELEYVICGRARRIPAQALDDFVARLRGLEPSERAGSVTVGSERLAGRAS